VNMRDLQHVTTDLLIDYLPEALKQSFDDALSLGATREMLWTVAQENMRRSGVKDWQFTYIAVHAYLFPEATTVPGYGN
jgi:hypothetical protein